MAAPKESFRIAQIRSFEAREAFSFHEKRAADDSHVWPRTSKEIQQYADDGCLFGVRRVQTNEIVALVYMTLERDEWEFGGLMVDGSLRKHRLGSALSRFAIAHTIVYEQPWANKQRIIAHVHEANQAPRNVLTRLGFELTTTQVKMSGDKAPASMKRNAAGDVVGDKLQFTDEGLQRLSRWFNEELDSEYSDILVEFDLGQADIEDLKRALTEIAGANR